MGVLPVQVLGAVVLQSRIGVGLVDDDALHRAGEGRHHYAVPGHLHLRQDARGHLEVPGVVGLAVFQDGAGR